MEKASEHIKAAKSYYRKKQFDKAQQEALLAVAAAESPHTKESSGFKILRAIINLRKSRKILIKLARKNPNAHSGALAVAYYKLGLAYLRVKLVKSAISNLTFAGELYKRQQKPDYQALADIYKILSKYYGRRYAAFYLGESAKFAALIDDEDARALHGAEIQSIQGALHCKNREFDDAGRLYLAAGEAYASLKDGRQYLPEIAMNFLNAASAAQKLGEYERARGYIRRANDMLHANSAPEGRQEEWAQLKALISKALEK